MAKLKSFEEYVANIDSAEEIENTEVEMGEPTKTEGDEEVITDEQGEDSVEVKDEVEGEEAGEEAEELEADTKEVSSEDDKGIVDSADDEIPSEEDAMTESEDGVEEDESEVEEDESEVEKDESDDDKSDDVVLVADMLKEAYEACKKEAKVWEEDMHDEHTIESYLKENAALVATLAMSALKEMKEDMTLEMYEATCEELKESYAKKMDEMKEAWSSEGEEIEGEEA